METSILKRGNLPVAKILFIIVFLTGCEADQISWKGCAISEEFPRGSYEATVAHIPVDHTVITVITKTKRGELLPPMAAINGVAVSSSDSNFSVRVKPGPYKILGRFMGYTEICTEEFELQPGDSLIVEFTLVEQPGGLH